MALTTIIPTFALMAAYVLFAQLVAKYVGFYRAQIAEPEAGRQPRFQALDGLRGFLAMGVFFHHAAIQYEMLESGNWQNPQSQFYAVLGPIAVQLFFMITGLLFWNKAIASGGTIDLAKLVMNRARRIGPLYLFSVGLCVLIILIVFNDYSSVFSWRGFIFLMHSLHLGLFELPMLGANSVSAMNAGVLWTLVYEWRFYIALPLLAQFVEPRRFTWLSAALIICGLFITNQVALTFLAGMLTAYLVHHPGIQNLARQPLLTPLWFMPILFFRLPESLIHAQCNALLLLPAFVAMACGNNLFGLLTCRGAKVLGTVSFSIYLMHGIVLRSFFTLLQRRYGTLIFTEAEMWGLVAIVGFLVIIVSMSTYRWIEWPPMRKPADRTPAPGSTPIGPSI